LGPIPNPHIKISFIKYYILNFKKLKKIYLYMIKSIK